MPFGRLVPEYTDARDLRQEESTMPDRAQIRTEIDWPLVAV
jgi:hypothetical protein